jgi:hypothetical protein
VVRILIGGVVVWAVTWSFLSWASAERLRQEVAESRAAIVKADAEKELLFRFVKDVLVVGEDQAYLYGDLVGAQRACRLDHEYDGVIVGLDTECVYSVAGLPAMNDLYEAGLPIVGVVVREGGGAPATWVAEHDVRFPVMQSASGPLAPLFEGAGTPFYLVLSKGQLGWGYLGNVPDPVIDGIVGDANEVEHLEGAICT